MKTTVIFFGLVQRSLQHVIGELRRNLLEPLERHGPVEIIYHTWKTGPLVNERAGENGLMVSPEEICAHFPEARGRVDDEAQFSKLMDWNHVYRVNPMRHHCSSEEAARVSIRNVLLSLHSLEMAFDSWLSVSVGNSDLVVVSRADLRFLRPLELPRRIEQWAVYVPGFHGWGGVNDRFAFGSREAMEVYARRSAFFDGFMLQPSRRNPEWVLMKWLERNQLEVRDAKMVFQRIRADGSVFYVDRRLAAATCAAEKGSSGAVDRSLSSSRFSGSDRSEAEGFAAHGIECSEEQLPVGFWTISCELERFIIDELPMMLPSGISILELGPGLSTRALCTAFPAARVVSLEHDRRFFDRIARFLAPWFGRVDLRLVELDPVTHWYDITPSELGKFDLLMVDGPPGSAGPMARAGALQLAENLNPGAIILLDDTNRADEKRMVPLWLEAGFELLEQRSSFALLRKPCC